MSYVNQEILKSFVAKNSWLTKDEIPDGLTEAILQADDIIRSRIGLAVPADPNDAPALLRNLACSIVIWFTTGLQGTIGEVEYSRRKEQYNNAIDTLDLIKKGSVSLYNDEGEALTTNAPSSFFKSDTPYMEKL